MVKKSCEKIGGDRGKSIHLGMGGNEKKNKSEVKEAAVQYNNYSIEEFLDIDRAERVEKYELHEGYMIYMQGASVNHVRITGNLMVGIGSFLKGKSCDVFSNDLKVGIFPKDSITYPDIVIACGPLEFSDKHQDVLVNPTAIIEVLSPTTEKYDRGNKFFYYRQLASFREYFLLDSLGHYLFSSRKQPNGQWLSYETTNPDESLFIESINLALPLS